MKKSQMRLIGRRLFVLVLALCLVAPVLPKGTVAYASKFSDEVKKDAYANVSLAEIAMKMSYDYDSYKNAAAFVKDLGKNAAGDENYCTVKDVQSAINYYVNKEARFPAHEDGSPLTKQEISNYLKEYYGVSDKFIKDFYLSYKAKPSKNVSDMMITVADGVYKGKAVTPKVTVVNAGKKMKKGRDFTVTYKNNKKAGTGTAVIKGKGKYKGTVSVNFNIKSADLDESLPTFSFLQVDIVGDDVFLIWNNGGGKDENLKVEVLRAEVGSDNFKVVGTVGKTNLGFVQHSYIDKGAGSGSYQYKVRAAKNGKHGKENYARTAEKTEYKWYKSDDGEYICMRPWRGGFADFTGFTADFDVVWNCDWNYEQVGENSYQVGMYWDPGDGTPAYNESFTYTITNEIFKDEGNGHTSYAINDVPISIE